MIFSDPGIDELMIYCDYMFNLLYQVVLSKQVKILFGKSNLEWKNVHFHGFILPVKEENLIQTELFH
jgi:hypothetical protein